MEMVSWLEGENFSDRPRCVCPSLAEFARCVNDKFDQENRDRLIPYLPKFIGTINSDKSGITSWNSECKNDYHLYWHLINDVLPTLDFYGFEFFKHISNLKRLESHARFLMNKILDENIIVPQENIALLEKIYDFNVTTEYLYYNRIPSIVNCLFLISGMQNNNCKLIFDTIDKLLEEGSSPTVFSKPVEPTIKEMMKNENLIHEIA